MSGRMKRKKAQSMRTWWELNFHLWFFSIYKTFLFEKWFFTSIIRKDEIFAACMQNYLKIKKLCVSDVWEVFHKSFFYSFYSVLVMSATWVNSWLWSEIHIQLALCRHRRFFQAHTYTHLLYEKRINKSIISNRA